MKKNAPNAYNKPRTRSAGSRTPSVSGSSTANARVSSNSYSSTANRSKAKNGVKSTSGSGKGSKVAGIAACFVVIAALAVGGVWYFTKGKAASADEKKINVIMADGTTQEKTVGEIRAELTSDRFFEGITIDGISVAGKTREEAVNDIKAKIAAEAPKVSLKFKLNDIEYPLDLSSLPFDSNAEEVVSQAFNYGRPAQDASADELINCYSKYQTLRNNPQAFTTESKINTDGVAEMVKNLLDPFNKEAVDAQIGDFNFNELKFESTESVDGCIVNIDKAVSDAKALLDAGTYEGVIDVEAEIVAQAFERRCYKGLWSPFFRYFNDHSE